MRSAVGSVGEAQRGVAARRLLMAAGIGGLLLVTAGCTTAAPVPTPTPTVHATRSDAVAARLHDAVYARLPAGARTAPALTWEDPTKGSTGDAVDTDGKSVLLAAACEGAGVVTVTVTGKPDRKLDCSRLTSVGPIDLTPTGDPAGAVEFDVRVTSGAPQYFAKMVAVRTKTSTD